MAITNRQIIANEIILHGITENVNTYDGWKRAGFQVQRGSKALFTTTIWKPCKVKARAKDGETREARQKLLLVKAAFFGASQVKRIEA